MTHIQKTRWSKEHLVEAVKYLAHQGQAGGLDFYEFGCYRAESTQLIEVLFYAYQIPIRRGFAFDSFEGLPAEKEGVDRFYLFAPGMFADVDRLFPTRQTTFVKGWFSELTPQHVLHLGMQPAALVHVDADLYISAIQCLDFMFSNRLILPGTVLAYDEFKSTERLEDGGESRAHAEICQKYGVVCEEIFRNVYHDRLECWQNTFVVKEIRQ